MSLSKAYEALEAMKTYEPGDLVYRDLRDVVLLQCALAQATALESIACFLDDLSGLVNTAFSIYERDHGKISDGYGGS